MNFLILTFYFHDSIALESRLQRACEIACVPYTAGGWIVGLFALEGFAVSQKADRSALCMHLLQLQSVRVSVLCCCLFPIARVLIASELPE